MNAEKMYQTFNESTVNFVQDFSLVSKSSMFSIYPELLKSFVKTNPLVLQEKLNQYLFSKYSTHIKERDNKFFLNQDFTNDISTGNEKMVMMIIDAIRKEWTNSTEETRDNIWKWLNVLLKLSNKIEIMKIKNA